MSFGRIGRFELEQPLGRGAMGEVWSARLGERLVALKVMDPDARRQKVHERAFLSEARAVAALDHPAIVAVHEFGLLTAAEADDLGLSAHSPWLAMELLPGGTLEARPPSSWHELYRVLLELLGALAHAHARGVIHRDLKTENLLFDADGALRLVDFGMVLDRGRALAERPLAGGTPAYMAPEQFSNDWRSQGPWTDLYAVGVLAWWGSTGRWPFLGSSLADWKRVHASASLPTFVPRWPCPPGFEAWLRRLLEKWPRDRPRDAAAARHALRRLAGDLVATGPRGAFSVAAALSAPTLDAVEVDLLHSPTVLLDDETLRSVRDGWVAPAHTVQAGPRPGDPGFMALPMPRDWRDHRPAERDSSDLGDLPRMGLGLFPFRQPALVGREEAQDKLWGALRAVVADGQPRAVLLHGGGGVGKSAVGDWLWHAAVEGGLVHAALNEDDAGRQGVDALLRHQWRAEGLEGEALLAWLYRALAEERAEAPDTPEAVAALVAPGADAASQVALALRTLGRRRQGRPLLLWLDDVHLDAGSRLLARRVLDGEQPALVVLAWREEDTDEAARTELDLLSRHPAAEVLPLHPLGVRHGARLLDGLLALSPDLAEGLARRSRGSPLFSLEVARDWVRRGLLEPGPRGYQLRAGAPPLPQSLAEVWRQRLSPLLHHREDRVAFELAALLDDPVQPAVLASACRALGVPEPVETWQLLLREGLVRPLSDGAWRFSHALLRRSLAEDCRASGRWGEAHAACAAALREHPVSPSHLLALHLAHAGEQDEALALLPPATEAAARCLRSMGRAHDRDRSWLELRLRRARVARIGEETAAARAEAQAVLSAATALDDERLIIAASRVVVQCDIDLGHFEEAAALAGRHAARSPLLLGYRAMALGRLGRLDVAEAIAAELLPHTAFLAAFLMGVFALERDEPELARARLEDAISRAEAADSTLNAASFRTELAVALRSAGDVAGALGVAQEAVTVLYAVGSPWVAGALAQVGLAALALGRHEVARRALLQVRKLTRERPDEGARHLALAGLARLGARLDDYDLVKEALSAPLPVLPLTRAASRDVVALWRATMGSLSSPSQAALCGQAGDRLEALLRT